MVRLVLLVAVSLSSLFVSNSAFALVHGNVLLGGRSIKLQNPVQGGKELKFSGVEYAFGFFFDPIPLVPVGFGATVYLADAGDESDIKDAKLQMISPEIIAWLPFFKLYGLKPYAKLGYMYGKLKFDNTQGETDGTTVIYSDFRIRGTHANIGVKWDAPSFGLLSVIAEVDFGFEKSELSSFSLSGGASDQVSQALDKKDDFKNVGYHIGIEVGL